MAEISLGGTTVVVVTFYFRPRRICKFGVPRFRLCARAERNATGLLPRSGREYKRLCAGFDRNTRAPVHCAVHACVCVFVSGVQILPEREREKETTSRYNIVVNTI